MIYGTTYPAGILMLRLRTLTSSMDDDSYRKITDDNAGALRHRDRAGAFFGWVA